MLNISALCDQQTWETAQRTLNNQEVEFLDRAIYSDNKQ